MTTRQKLAIRIAKAIDTLSVDEACEVILNSLTAVDTEAEARGYEKAENECFASRKILWDRMKEWNDEWRAENPEERALCTEDAMRLIEWKLERAKEEARRSALELKEQSQKINQLFSGKKLVTSNYIPRDEVWVGTGPTRAEILTNLKENPPMLGDSLTK